MSSRLLPSGAMVFWLFASSSLAAPPRVFYVYPDDGDREIDPNTREIRVVFDGPMDRTCGHSIVGGGPTFPKLATDPGWMSDRVLIIPVTLEPNKEYWIGLNSKRFRNFRGVNGEAIDPYPIGFSTGDRRATVDEPVTPEKNREALAALKKLIAREYSYRDRHRNLDWDKLFQDHQKPLGESATPRAFARQVGRVLAVAEDIHLTFGVGKTEVPTFRRSITANCNTPLFPTLIPNFQRVNRTVWTGRFEGSIGYIAVTSWSSDREEDLKPALDLIARAENLKGLVIDVRMNSGGSEFLARKLAGCFVDAPVEYAKHKVMKAGELKAAESRMLKPVVGGKAFGGRVAVLMGPVCMSSCESFLLMMRQSRSARLFGARSYGSSGNPQPHELGNGVTANIPCWQDLLPDGSCFEGQGIVPDIEVRGMPADFQDQDPVIDRALKWVRGG